MSKQLIFGVIAAVVIAAGGAGAYFAFREDSPANSSTTTTSTDDADERTEDLPAFNPVSTEGVEFEATFAGGDDATETRVIVQKDEKGSIKLNTTAEGTNSEMYQVDGQYVMCSSGQCFKLTNTTLFSSSSDQFDYDESKIASFRENIKNEGKVSCASGTCDKWTSENEGTKSTFLLDSQGRIQQVTGESGGSNFQIDFTYKDISTIALPSNVTELPGI